MSALTKILIVLQLVFSLVCSVLLVLMVSRTENYKSISANSQAQAFAVAATLTKTQGEKDAALARISDLQNQVNTANINLTKATGLASADASKSEGEIIELKNKVMELTSQVATLNATVSTSASSIAAKDAELEKLRPQVADLTMKYNEISRSKMEGDNQLRAAEQAIRKLQELLAQAPTGGAGAVAPIGSGDQITTISAAPASGKVNGTISDVALSSGRTLIEMPLGTRDGIQVGTKVYVYRSTGYVGDATVQRVTPEQSVAIVISTKAGETVQKGDFVSTTGQ